MILIPTEFNRKVVDRKKTKLRISLIRRQVHRNATQIVQTREIQELADIYNILQCVG